MSSLSHSRYAAERNTLGLDLDWEDVARHLECAWIFLPDSCHPDSEALMPSMQQTHAH
jgi:hypothetical protein